MITESGNNQTICPKCSSQMNSMHHENATMEYCPKCKGMWLDGGVLSKTIGPLNYSRGTRETSFRCPRCKLRLFEHELDTGGRDSLHVDRCNSCAGLFLDKGEYQRSKKAYSLSRENRTPVKARNTTESNDYNTLDPDSNSLVLFQYLTGLPLEVGSVQKHFSPAITIIIAANIIIFFISFFVGLEKVIATYGMRPSYYPSLHWLSTSFSSMFIHAGLSHIFVNMYFLFIAGDNVETVFCTIGFCFLYLFCGFAGDLCHTYMNLTTQTPTIGASGAISGILGALLVINPWHKFLHRIFYFAWLNYSLEVPLFIYLGVWFIVQIASAVFSMPGTAWWAHIGGFAAGVAITLVLRVSGVVKPLTLEADNRY